MDAKTSFVAEVGDWIVVEPRRPGQTRRVAKVVQIFGDPGHELYRVRWRDGTVSLVCRDGHVHVPAARAEPEERVLIHEP